MDRVDVRHTGWELSDLGDPDDLALGVPETDQQGGGDVAGVVLELYLPDRGGIVLDADGGFIKLHFTESEKRRLLASELPNMGGETILAVFTVAQRGRHLTPSNESTPEPDDRPDPLADLGV